MGIREDWNDKILIFDGGMGSLLQGAGLKPGDYIISLDGTTVVGISSIRRFW